AYVLSLAPGRRWFGSRGFTGAQRSAPLRPTAGKFGRLTVGLRGECHAATSSQHYRKRRNKTTLYSEFEHTYGLVSMDAWNENSHDHPVIVKRRSRHCCPCQSCEDHQPGRTRIDAYEQYHNG